MNEDDHLGALNWTNETHVLTSFLSIDHAFWLLSFLPFPLLCFLSVTFLSVRPNNVFPFYPPRLVTSFFPIGHLSIRQTQIASFLPFYPTLFTPVFPICLFSIRQAQIACFLSIHHASHFFHFNPSGANCSSFLPFYNGHIICFFFIIISSLSHVFLSYLFVTFHLCLSCRSLFYP